MEDTPLVTCMCVTRDRVPMLRRAIRCFLRQTYVNRELVIVYESDDNPTSSFLATLSHPAIRAIELSLDRRLSLGLLRNISVQEAKGEYVAQWDDDDWHSPDRLAQQLRAIRESGRIACCLARWTLYDEELKRAYLSQMRCWEGSLVARRDGLPRYSDMVKGEDTIVVRELIELRQLILIDRPDLYVYIYHGTNTWDRYHWESNIAQHSCRLEKSATDNIAFTIGAR